MNKQVEIALKDLLMRSVRMAGYVKFVVANEEAVDGDLEVMKAWLDSLDNCMNVIPASGKNK